MIIAYSANIDDALAALKADKKWQCLRAMKDEKVNGFPNDFYSMDQPVVREKVISRMKGVWK